MEIPGLGQPITAGDSFDYRVRDPDVDLNQSAHQTGTRENQLPNLGETEGDGQVGLDSDPHDLPGVGIQAGRDIDGCHGFVRPVEVVYNPGIEPSDR
jgi:hypothetical protein